MCVLDYLEEDLAYPCGEVKHYVFRSTGATQEQARQFCKDKGKRLPHDSNSLGAEGERRRLCLKMIAKEAVRSTHSEMKFWTRTMSKLNSGYGLFFLQTTAKDDDLILASASPLKQYQWVVCESEYRDDFLWIL